MFVATGSNKTVRCINLKSPINHILVPPKITCSINHILVPPKITCSKGYDSFTTVGGTLQITCTVHSNPRANITWEVSNSTEGTIDSPQEEGNIRAIEEVTFTHYCAKFYLA